MVTEAGGEEGKNGGIGEDGCEAKGQLLKRERQGWDGRKEGGRGERVGV